MGSRIWKFGDDVDTDQIVASQYLLVPDIGDMLPHVFESLRPGFAGEFSPGGLIVAGRNFGCGSSREQAPIALKALGVAAVIANSFARIFFRNAINIGLPLVTIAEPLDGVGDGDTGTIDFADGTVTIEQTVYGFPPYPSHLSGIISAGGLLSYINTDE